MSMLGRAEEARAALEDAARVAERTGEARLRTFSAIYGARAALGDRPEDAAAQASAAAIEASELKLTALRAMACAVLAAAHLACGRADEAERASVEALMLRDELGALEEDEAEVFLVRARVLEAAGRYVDAHEVRERGRARIRELADRIADPDLRVRFLEDVPAHRELMAGG